MSSGSISHIIGQHAIVTIEVIYVYYTEIMTNKRKNINHKLGMRIPLTCEQRYGESNISYAGTLQFLLSLIVLQTRTNYRQDVSLVVRVGEVYCTCLSRYQYALQGYVFQEGFLHFRIPTYNQNVILKKYTISTYVLR
jgi:hypothetical protein